MTTTKQPDLFTRVDDPHPVGHVPGSDTSHAAAVSMQPLTGSLRVRVYDHIKTKPAGVTCDEVENDLDLKHQTCSARIRELVKMGYVVDSGRRRPTSSGRSARVYELTGKDPGGGAS